MKADLVDFVEDLVGVPAQRARPRRRQDLRALALVWQGRRCVNGSAELVTMLQGESAHLVLQIAARWSGMAVRGIRRSEGDCRWKSWPLERCRHRHRH